MYYCIAEVDTNSDKTTEKDRYKKDEHPYNCF